jgi:hypothetical protein
MWHKQLYYQTFIFQLSQEALIGDIVYLNEYIDGKHTTILLYISKYNIYEVGFFL